MARSLGVGPAEFRERLRQRARGHGHGRVRKRRGRREPHGVAVPIGDVVWCNVTRRLLRRERRIRRPSASRRSSLLAGTPSQPSLLPQSQSVAAYSDHQERPWAPIAQARPQQMSASSADHRKGAIPTRDSDGRAGEVREFRQSCPLLRTFSIQGLTQKAPPAYNAGSPNPSAPPVSSHGPLPLGYPSCSRFSKNGFQI